MADRDRGRSGLCRRVLPRVSVRAQRAAAAQSLAGIGAGGLTGAQQAAQNVVTAGMTPQQLYNQYASVIFGAPSAAYNANFAGTQGSTTSGMGGGISLQGMFK